ncbi:MAG: extracellular metalloproteinase, partial [Planctomycetes bacterium]|nr:extracellular metalloproteinase [Planctomycetota bacterium]
GAPPGPPRGFPPPPPAPRPAAAAAPSPEPLLPGAGRRLWRGDPVPPGPTPEARARAVLAREARRVGLHRAPGELVLVRAFESPLGTHVRFRQEAAGIPVHGSEASVHWARDGRLLAVNADLFPVPGGRPAPLLDAAAALDAASGLASGGGEEPPERGEPRLAWLPTGKSALLAWEAVVRSEEETLRVFVDAADGGILLAEDLRRSAEGTARVFDPNPVWTRRDAALLDGDDADHPALEDELVEVPLPRLDGSGFLRGRWADLTPTRPRAFEPTLEFRYTRADPRFEQANVYFHLDRLQEHVHAVLGLEGAAGEPLRADAHHGKYDNSFFDSGNGRIYFGDGGVDDAEDADIIAHEYGHALQDALVPGFGRSHEAGSMGEGFGDWIAASRRTSGDETWDAAVGSWDATSFAAGTPPALRRVDGTKEYPRDLEGEVHADGEIWSSALREIERRLGTADADRVIFASHLLLTPRASFADGAAAILAADLALRGGAGEEDLRAAFGGRGIPPGDDPLEGDDGPADATPVDRARFDGLYAADDDWFRIESGPGPGVTCVAEPLSGGGRASLALFDGSLRLLSESGRFAAVPFAASGPLASRTVLYLRVSPGREGRCPYHLRIDGTTFPPPADRFEPNGEPGAAARLPTGAAQRI